MALDPTEHSVSELRSELNETDDADELEAALEIEQNADDPRSTAIGAIQGRLNAVRSEGAESDSEDVEAEDDAEAADEDDASEDGEEEAEAEESDEDVPLSDIPEDELPEFDDLFVDEEEEEAEPEPKRSFPEPDSDEQVVFDPTGAGDTGTPTPPIAGHDTIHLTDDDNEPRCGASGGAKMQVATRSSLPEGVDECQNCR